MSLSVVGCLHWQSVLVSEDLVACSLCDAIAASGTAHILLWLQPVLGMSLNIDAEL